MIARMKFFLAAVLSIASACIAVAQQQPVMKVEITRIGVFRPGGTSVISVDVREEGANYVTPPTVTLSAPDLPGGSQAYARAYLAAEGGTLAAIEVYEGGSGYSHGPTVTIENDGGGTGATAVSYIGDVFDPPNEAFGPAKKTILITAEAIGTYMVSSFTYSFFVNGISIGVTTGPVPPTAAPPTVPWAPPQPGSYFITVVATDGVSTYTSLPVRYFATGTVVASPLTHTLVPQGSSVVLQADATVGMGFIREVQFFDGGQPIGLADGTIPYSLVYQLPGAIGTTHYITAQARTNTGDLLPMSDPVELLTVQPITPLPTCVISSPTSGSTIPVPAADSSVPVTVDTASRPGGLISKVELYVDGVLTGSKNTFPYSFAEWKPSVVGQYRLVALTYDDKNNVIASATNLVTVGANQVPEVAITTPSSNYSTNAGQSVVLIATASDSKGVSQVRFLANGVQVGAPITTPPYTTTWTPAGGGTHTLTAEATNTLGGIATSAPVTVQIAPNLLPTVSITSPANGGSVRVGAGCTIAATASDADGIVSRVQFYANGLSIGTSTTPPYKVQWSPAAEGLYRLIAVVVDNAGAASTSATVLANASSSAGGSIVGGTYQGLGEAGNFSIAGIAGSRATFVAYSTIAGATKTYLYSDVPVDLLGAFGVDDAKGNKALTGQFSGVGVSGAFDAGRLKFIGLDTAGGSAAGGCYTGSITGQASSKVVGIVGADGSVILYASSGSFADAGGGGLTGRVDASGAFAFNSARGNRFSGRVDATGGLLTGTLSGSQGGAFTATLTSLATDATAKVSGSAQEVGSNIHVASNGNTFDQVLLTGTSASVSADPGQVTRISYIDLSDDIVQVEFSGAGRLAISLDNPQGPMAASHYNQPSVAYMKGNARIVITGADETTNVSVFSVGRATAVNQTLFRSDVAYDGVADLGSISILSRNGKFGGVRAANASFVASDGIAGVCAPAVAFAGPVYVGDISAAYAATPMLLLGSATDVCVTGGDFSQGNGKAVQVSGIPSLRFVDGTTSHGVTLHAQSDRSRLEQDGVDVTAQIVLNPPY